MIELVIAETDWRDIGANLLNKEIEACAIMFISSIQRKNGSKRLLTRFVEFPNTSDYTRQGPVEAELSPEYVARVTKRARLEGLGLVFVHCHLGNNKPSFSVVDDAGELKLVEFLSRRLSTLDNAALVVSLGGARARLLGTSEFIKLTVIGHALDVIDDPEKPDGFEDQTFDRQIRAFGQSGQRALAALKFAIVGLGGTGSLVAQQLAHLGVCDVILIDPDVIEKTNLNRVVNATTHDIGTPKVEVAARYFRSLNPNANISIYFGDVTRTTYAKELLEADIIFGCTDSHGSRAILQQISYQYFIPLFDMGVIIVAKSGELKHVYGRIQQLSPGLGCFSCDGLLDPALVRQDMMTPLERAKDPYIPGAGEPAPAVISINGVVASLAVTAAISFVTRLPLKGRHLLYNFISANIRLIKSESKGDCYICSIKGAYGRGRAWPLLARDD